MLPGDAPAALRDARETARARPEVRRRPIPNRVTGKGSVQIFVVDDGLDQVAEQDSFFGLSVGDGKFRSRRK